MDKIVVLDFGGQYAHLIANRIRRLNVYSEIMPADAGLEGLKKPDVKGIILSGGPKSVHDKESPKPKEGLFKIEKPVLGLCYGHQLMAQALDGIVEKGKIKEYGSAILRVKKKKDLFEGLKDKEIVWMSHGDSVAKLPEGFEVLGSTDDCRIAAMGNGLYFGLQFHPEVTHTPSGMKILENFIKITGAKKEWNMKNFIDEKINEIKDFAKEKNVFLLVSGGVDSTVCFTLLTKALGEERVYGLHIDNGFMRKDESLIVKESLTHFKNLHIVDASEEFLKALEGIINPEVKRRIIGEKFIEVANNSIKYLELEPGKWILGQGTIYPDTIETAGTKHADLIKTHHNRVQLVQELIKEGKVIEPISQLYKDEARKLGIELGIDEKLVWRHPFPGPGLAVRCLCAEKEDLPDKAGDIRNEINKFLSEIGMKAIILPIKSVGVQGDARTYNHPVLISGIADWATMEDISTQITNKWTDINRVLAAIKPEMVEKVSLKPGHLTKDRLDKLREADAIVNRVITEKGLMQEIWQFPVVLIPIAANSGESIVLRPVYSQEAMTARFAEIPLPVVNEMADEILKIEGIDAVFYDVTHKPPGTIEWE